MEHNIKTDLKRKREEYMEWIHLLRDPVNAVSDLQVP